MEYFSISLVSQGFRAEWWRNYGIVRHYYYGMLELASESTGSEVNQP